MHRDERTKAGAGGIMPLSDHTPTFEQGNLRNFFAGTYPTAGYPAIFRTTEPTRK